MNHTENKYTENKGITILLAAAVFIVMIILWTMPSSKGWYDTMIGEKGLKNVISTVRISVVTACFMVVPLSFLSFILSLVIFTERKFAGILTFLLVTSLLAGLAGNISSSICHFKVQCSLNDIESMKNITLMKACVQDIKNDEYEEYTVNNSYAYYDTDSFSYKGSTSFFYEYKVNLMYGDKCIKTVQVGNEDYKRFKEKPLSGYDAKITVYKNSGFLRSYEPSVEYTEEEAAENIFTLTVSDGVIYYHKNAETLKVKGGYFWAGYRKGEIRDYGDYISDAGFSESEEYFDLNNENGFESDELNQICICRRTGEKSYERVSNMITLDDFEINEYQNFDSENIIYTYDDSWKSGFEYHGEKIIRDEEDRFSLPLLKSDPEGVLVQESEGSIRKYYIAGVENNGGFDFYYIDNSMWIAESQVNDAELYYSQEPLYTYFVNSDGIESYNDITAESEKISELYKAYKNSFRYKSGQITDYEGTLYYFVTGSEDDIIHKSVVICLYEKKAVFYDADTGLFAEIPDEFEEYVNKYIH